MLQAAYYCTRISSLSLQPNSGLNLYDVAGQGMAKWDIGLP